MRTLLLVFLCVASWPLHATAAPRDGVNAILGDDSYVARFGTLPGPEVDEDLRLRVHLEYVEGLLRGADTSALSPAQRTSRMQMLDHLHAYHTRGVFPRNRAFAHRRPHFIDEDGRICAVGYLIEQSAGRAFAEALNAKFEWAYLVDMNDDALARWALASGLSTEELATIQPAYGPPEELATLGAKGYSKKRIVESLDRDTDVQDCATRIGLSESIERVPLTVTQRDNAIEIVVDSVGSATFRACVREHVRVQSWPLGKRERMTVHHTVRVRGGSAGTPLDVNEVTELYRRTASSWGSCVDASALGTAPTKTVTLKVTADPMGKAVAVEVTPWVRGARACFEALYWLQTPPFKGMRTTIEITL